MWIIYNFFIWGLFFLCPLACENIDHVDKNKTLPVVKTENGKVVGRVFYTEDENKKYYAFRSIPYAQPPTGKLRFKSPEPIGNWSGTINGTVDPPFCMQVRKDMQKVSEDCLYLNVYTPCVKSKRPVLVWIHGGFFIAGSGAKSLYGPDYLLNEDIVLVSINYRVGVFGFLSTKDNASPGNYAIKDQLLALKWIKTNIKYFGGDPDSITIYGESAGAASVSVLVSTPLSRGLFHRAIMSSGNNLCLWSRSLHPKVLAFQIGSALGIVTNDTQVLIDSLREVDALELLEHGTKADAITTILTNPLNGLFFAPTIEPATEDAVVTSLNHESLKNGEFNQVPLLVGFNSGEGISFEDALSKVRLFLTKYDYNYKALVPIDLNVNGTEVKKEIGEMIKRQYFGSNVIALSILDVGHFITDDQFIRPTLEYIRLVSRRVTTYAYQFSYQGHLSNINRHGDRGVGHGEDLEYLWNTGVKNATEDDLLTRKRLVRLWGNFVKFGNGTPTSDPLLQNVQWEPTNSSQLNYLDIGNNLTMKGMVGEDNLTFWDKLYFTFGNPPYDTY